MADRRVLQLLGPSTGGIRRVVAGLAEGLVERGWEVRTAGPRGVLDGLVKQDAVVPVLGRSALAARRALAPLLAQVDVVHAHGLTAGWLAATMRGRPPLVVSVHNLVLDEVAGPSAPVLRWLEGWLPAATDRTIALSPEVARRFSGRPGAGRIRVIAPTASPPVTRRPPAEVRAELGMTGSQHLVVAGASRLTAQKDISTLLRSVALVPSVRLAVYGSGAEEGALRALALELGIDGRVVFGGQRASVADEMAAADAVVLSSIWESGPLMLVEAMSLGVPVVSTPVGLARDLVVDGITGRLTPIGNPVAMATALSSLLDEPVVARRMGDAGRARVSELHGPSAAAAATERVYDEVVR